MSARDCVSYELFIDGKKVAASGKGRIDRKHPSSGQVVASYACATGGDGDCAPVTGGDADSGRPSARTAGVALCALPEQAANARSSTAIVDLALNFTQAMPFTGFTASRAQSTK